MANGVSVFIRILLGLCVLSLSLEPKIMAVAIDEDERISEIHDDGDDSLPRHQLEAEGVDLSGGAVYGSGLNSELCDTDISSFLPPPYSNISEMACSPIWNTFILRYSQRDDHDMTIILSAVYTTGWVGMGFSKDGMMVGSSAMVGWFNKKGQARIQQYYLQGTSVSQVIVGKGELPLRSVPSVVVLHGPMIYLAFQVQFGSRLGRQPIILAFSTAYPHHYRLSHHVDKTTIMFDFSAGSASTLYVKSSQMKKNHGILGLLGWGVILPLGAIIARYLRQKDPLWYYLHAIIQLVGFIFVLATVLLGIQLYDKIRNANVQAHRGIGIFALVLCILQILAVFLRPNKDAKIRKYWNWYHHWFGRIALFFGALNVMLGIQVGYAGNAWKTGYGFLLGMIFVTIIVLEALLWMRKSNLEEKTPSPPSFPMNPIS
ncbi:Cytochrom_B561 domain-containing protein/DOMON domain-containing protein [Cephalotus follicularis]|uniref:Cytochrom_B561 domain-containing protein/DOMON domain-containing protein n=1 Tax=Cephalotus follicularis TaxID=3775 RepID=A0A1Q3AM71_CEPFO|nr:Cytochrom_B561 domain-containing protein/DOMON domain-containing protein [Cephalotus follicularis]